MKSECGPDICRLCGSLVEAVSDMESFLATTGCAV